ncbi:calcium-binding protein [Pseudonocardiaceae bacterium YIM PH 21723]|nr:calcium-binding protein [Pseudonocardiaceae bacterium YIM PH 21723]
MGISCVSGKSEPTSLVTPVTTTTTAAPTTSKARPTTTTAAPTTTTTSSVVAPPPAPAPPPRPQIPAPEVPAPPPAPKEVYYANCDQARAAGAAPIHAGQPGYRKALDRDGDGIACDK